MNGGRWCLFQFGGNDDVRDWVVARTPAEAVEAMTAHNGGDDWAVSGTVPVALDWEQADALEFVAEDGTRIRSLLDEAGRQVMLGLGPCHIACCEGSCDDR